MGKKAKFKLFRRMAAGMPAINVGVVIGEKLTGKEAMMQGINEVQGKPVGQNSVVIKKRVVEKPLNHNRQMKKIYNQRGEAGVQAYLLAVKKHSEKQKKNEPV